jgi:16S rRNA (cytosine1402-N4)-methyltransferase
VLRSEEMSTFELEKAMAHVPVLTHELLDVLDLQPNSRVIDCTFGAGGHATSVAEQLGPEGFLVACDRDPVAREYYAKLKPELMVPSRFCAGDFADTLHRLALEGFRATHIYLDLGLSSMQVDTEERGFSYSYDAPLDMRMDPSLALTAAHLVNEETERDLARIFREYGEERHARRIARSIVARRAVRPFARTGDLVDVVKSAVPAPARFGSRNPARRVFQALRIAVNDELQSLRRALPTALRLLEPGGVIAVISFHSLEDRIVKDFFNEGAHPCTCPPEFPVCVCGRTASLEILTSRPVTPGIQEVQANPRSSSAKLRAAKKL